jgi:hypothetical protein
MKTYGPQNVRICERHNREPTLYYRHDKYSTNTSPCPYCADGELHGKYHKHRSVKRWEREVALVAAQRYLNMRPIDIFWDCREGFGEDSVTGLLNGERDEVEMELWDFNSDVICDEEWTALEYVIGEFELDCDPQDLRDILDVPVEMDLVRLARNTDAYITLDLPVEHDHYWREYEDVEEELEFFGINPADLREYYPEIEWPDIQDRTPLIKVIGLVEGWVNCFYTGYWYVMMDAGETLEMIIKGELKESMVLKAGANIIIHDYVNGASSINTHTLADLQVDTRTLYNDGANRYGIQSCCGMGDDAWNGVLE